MRRLEEGNLPLDQAVSLFEEGTRLARLCNEQLDTAELKVKQLLQTPDGAFHERSVMLDAGDEAGNEA